MVTVGILGAGARLRRALAEHGAALVPWAAGPDLLVVGPDWTGPVAGRCRALLTPGRVGPGLAQAGWVVSYGFSPRDTLTLSSVGDRTALVALQRDLVGLDGRRWERQELRVPLPDGTTPGLLLAAVGARLLIGGPDGPLP